MTLIEYLIKSGWVAGCCYATYQEPDAIHFLPPFSPYIKDKSLVQEKLTLTAPLINGVNEVSHDDYLAECKRIGVPPHYIAGEVLTEAVKKTPVSPHLPPISRIYWGPSAQLLPSIPVIAVTAGNLGIPQHHTGYYSHAESRWIVGLDWIGKPDVIEWWPIPEFGTGTKPPKQLT